MKVKERVLKFKNNKLPKKAKVFTDTIEIDVPKPILKPVKKSLIVKAEEVKLEFGSKEIEQVVPVRQATPELQQAANYLVLFNSILNDHTASLSALAKALVELRGDFVRVVFLLDAQFCEPFKSRAKEILEKHQGPGVIK